MRIWRHLKILKRSGRGHAKDGVISTTTGQCAVECPACPHPGRNLPPDWKNAPEKCRLVNILLSNSCSGLINKICSWLYSLNLTIDANFRLKNKARGIKNDPPLSGGWAHWVPDEPYERYVNEFGHQAEVGCYFLSLTSL